MDSPFIFFKALREHINNNMVELTQISSFYRMHFSNFPFRNKKTTIVQSKLKNMKRIENGEKLWCSWAD